MFAKPEPYVLVREFDGQSAVFQCHPRRPDFLPASLAKLFEMQRRVLRVGFQQCELLVGPGANVGRQRMIIVPEIRVRAVHHEAGLKELCFSVFVVGHCATDAIVDAPGSKIGLKLRVNGLRAVHIKPRVQFFQFARRQSSDGAFDLSYSIQAHLASLPVL